MSGPLLTKVISAWAHRQEDLTAAVYANQVCTEHYHSVLEAYAYQIIKEKLS